VFHVLDREFAAIQVKWLALGLSQESHIIPILAN